MKKILFVCHGNICRSPMAEFVLKDMVKKRGLEGRYEIASAATSREEIGNPVYPPARRKLAEHGIVCAGHQARQMTKSDYDDYDWIVCMDRANVRNASRIVGGDPQNKIRLLLDFTERSGQEVADPWYTGDFEATWQDVLQGCEGLISWNDLHFYSASQKRRIASEAKAAVPGPPALSMFSVNAPPLPYILPSWAKIRFVQV